MVLKDVCVWSLKCGKTLLRMEWSGSGYTRIETRNKTGNPGAHRKLWWLP
ncbi:hypothetical protein HanIR_Chr04g0181561 [Helianthus annuus]|nr:hypothetical protein HanIR_Chr04g0181561 [Helianthus annuus]